ncbi:MAG: c-type cytochrome [Isosphaeraceae bacterium]
MSTDTHTITTDGRAHGPTAAAIEDRPKMDIWSGERAGARPVPRWLMGLGAALLVWGGYYLNQYGGGFRADALEGTYRRVVAGAPVPIDPVVLGRKLFSDRGCIGCHQLTGQGLAGQFPPLAGSEWVHGSPERLSRIVLQGFQGPVKVRGETYNNVMPGFGPILDDQQAAAVLTFIRQEWGNKAGPVSPSVVTRARAAHASRTTPWTAEELKAFGAGDEPKPP